MIANKILPPLRNDLSFRDYDENGEKFIVLYDSKGYAGQPVALPVAILSLFNLIDGLKTAGEFSVQVKELIGSDADYVLEHFLNLVEFLDFHGYLDSENYAAIKNDIDTYLASGIRNPVCADNSYPSEPGELAEYLDELFSAAEPAGFPGNATSIVVPHIDFRIGPDAHKCYAAGFHAIRNTPSELYVILGTSHQGNSDYFMLTKKDFETPLGVVETDRDVIEMLSSKLTTGITIDEMAHRHEHSIEFQVVLLQHYFNNRDFKILPVLVGSFHNFINNGSMPDSDNRLTEFLSKLNDTITEKNIKAVFIASADMAHIGRKFHDDFDAESQFGRLRAEDKTLLGYLRSCEPDKFFNSISAINDKNRICGLSPVYCLLKLRNPASGEVLGYNIWNEAETKSAVSFSSIAFY